MIFKKIVENTLQTMLYNKTQLKSCLIVGLMTQPGLILVCYASGVIYDLVNYFFQ